MKETKELRPKTNYFGNTKDYKKIKGSAGRLLSILHRNAKKNCEYFDCEYWDQRKHQKKIVNKLHMRAVRCKSKFEIL